MSARAALVIIAIALLASTWAGDMMRKSIVFNKKTPDVFYCPQRKPTGFDKMIVQARPLNKLCEHGGKSLPPDYKSDCYNDIDESEYACKEKYRIMKRIRKEQKLKAESPNDFTSVKY